MLRAALLNLFVVASLVLVAGCGSPKSACNATTCSHGCCDADGVCRSGGTASECGLSGNACSTCASPPRCSADGICVVLTSDAGGPFDAGWARADAGSPVVDAGSPVVDSGSPDAGRPDASTPLDAGASLDAGSFDGGHSCQVIPTFPIAQSFSVYARTPDGGLEHAVAQHLYPQTPPYDSLEVDIYWAFTGQQTGLQIPSVRNLASEANYSTCGSCVVIRENCPDLDSCERAYFARAGTIHVADVTRGHPGQFKVRLENVLLQRWRLGPDRPHEDGGCLFLETTTFDVPHN